MVTRATRLQGITATLLAFTPAGACAEPAQQSTAARSNRSPGTPGVTLQGLQKRLAGRLMAGDTDGDGRVSKAEFLAGAQGGKGDPAKRFARLDRDKDGLLDRSEVDLMLARRFKRMDVDGDGVASAEERAAASAKRNAARPAVD